MFKYLWIIIIVAGLCPFILITGADFILTFKENKKKMARYLIGVAFIILFYTSLYFFLWG